jgi:hypothetical protein
MTCRWCHQPIVFQTTWVHVGPQVGSGWTHRRECEPDMQSMHAEPAEELAEIVRAAILEARAEREKYNEPFDVSAGIIEGRLAELVGLERA